MFGVLPSFQGSLEKLGIGADGVKSTPLSGEPDLLRGPSPEANALIQGSVEATYARFLDIVAKARRKTPQQVDAIAQGRVWDGGTARQLGLIDGFGGMEEAVAKAAAAGQARTTKSVRYIEPPKSVEDELVEMIASDREDDSAAPADAFAVFAEGAQEAARRGAGRNPVAARRPGDPGPLPRMRAGGGYDEQSRAGGLLGGAVRPAYSASAPVRSG